MLIFHVSFRLSDVTEITCRLKRVVNAQTNPHALVSVHWIRSGYKYAVVKHTKHEQQQRRCWHRQCCGSADVCERL